MEVSLLLLGVQSRRRAELSRRFPQHVPQRLHADQSRTTENCPQVVDDLRDIFQLHAGIQNDAMSSSFGLVFVPKERIAKTTFKTWQLFAECFYCLIGIRILLLFRILC